MTFFFFLLPRRPSHHRRLLRDDVVGKLSLRVGSNSFRPFLLTSFPPIIKQTKKSRGPQYSALFIVPVCRKRAVLIGF